MRVETYIYWGDKYVELVRKNFYTVQLEAIRMFENSFALLPVVEEERKAL